MREYIKNLTDNLISKNRYDEVDLRLRAESSLTSLVEYVKVDLEAGDVKNMNPETLGRIMANFEIGDVMASKADIVEWIHFNGDCEDLLRELVALCLAFVIKDRLDCAPENERLIPVYRRKLCR